MGHARFPTSGTVELKDVHPHEVGDILGMHNGTLSKVAEAKVAKSENDSRLLFTMIQNRGIDETFRSIEGSYACSWVNKADKTLNFFRNNERGLWFACLEGDENTVYWASELSFLEFTLSRRSPNAKLKAFSLPPGTLLSFPLYSKKFLSDPKLRVIAKKEEKKPAGNPSNLRYQTLGEHTVDFYTICHMFEEGCWMCGRRACMADYHAGKLKWKTQECFECEVCTSKGTTLSDDMPMLM